MDNQNQNGKMKTIFQFIKFCIAGLLNTLVDVGGFATFNTLGIAFFGREVGLFVTVAQVFSYALGMLNSWLINSSWTFNDQSFKATKLLKFIVVNLLSLVVNILILNLCRSMFEMDAFVAKLIATPFGLIVNFIGNRLFVFKEKEKV